MHCAGHSNAGVIAAISLAGAAIMWPSLIALPYELLIMYHIMAWAQHRQRGSNSTAPIRLLQAYTGALCAFPVDQLCWHGPRFGFA